VGVSWDRSQTKPATPSGLEPLVVSMLGQCCRERRHARPVRARRRPVVGKFREFRADLLERQSDPLV
jgi:hypothetical protein